MAGLRLDVRLAADPDRVWSAVRAVGTPHVDLVPGFVTGCEVDGHARTVTFVTGAVAREVVADIDDEGRRLAYAVVESGLGMEHHHAVMQVVPDGGGTVLEWHVDVLPDAVAPQMREMMAAAAQSMTRHLV